MALALPWVLVFATPPGLLRRTGSILALAGIVFCGWIAVEHETLVDQFGSLDGSASRSPR